MRLAFSSINVNKKSLMSDNTSFGRGNRERDNCFSKHIAGAGKVEVGKAGVGNGGDGFSVFLGDVNVF